MSASQNREKTSGFVLVLSVLILTALLLAGSYLITISGTERKIADAQATATKNYYLAEAGVNEMIWDIKNQPLVSSAFLAGTLDSSFDITRSSIFTTSIPLYPWGF